MRVWTTCYLLVSLMRSRLLSHHDLTGSKHLVCIIVYIHFINWMVSCFMFYHFHQISSIFWLVSPSEFTFASSNSCKWPKFKGNALWTAICSFVDILWHFRIKAKDQVWNVDREKVDSTIHLYSDIVTVQHVAWL